LVEWFDFVCGHGMQLRAIHCGDLSARLGLSTIKKLRKVGSHLRSFSEEVFAEVDGFLMPLAIFIILFNKVVVEIYNILAVLLIPIPSFISVTISLLIVAL